jgi:glycerol-3-phosphate acyltransferase PlsY
MTQWLMVLLGYVMGNCPTAYVLGRKFTGKDIRNLGDGNMGARNAYHEISHKVGVLVFTIDTAKGFLAVLAAQLLGLSQVVVLATGVAVVAGHNWPVFLHFKGGRGEATTIGVFYALIPLPTLIMTIPTVLMLLIVKNVIITTAAIFISLLLVCWWLDVSGLLVIYAIGLAILIALTHFFNRHRVAKAAGAEIT